MDGHMPLNKNIYINERLMIRKRVHQFNLVMVLDHCDPVSSVLCICIIFFYYGFGSDSLVVLSDYHYGVKFWFPVLL